MKEVVLKVAQPGSAAGEAFLLKTETKPETAEVTDGNAELAKFYSAVSALDCELADSAANSDGEATAIFEAERILLKDPKYAEMVRQSIENDGMSSVSAVEKAGNALAAEIRRSGTATISQRGGDLNGLTERLVSLLRGEEKDIPTHPFILAAGELSPAQLSAVNPERILGIVTAKGSPASHVSIIAGNLGVPYYYGSEEAIAEIGSGVRLVLDSGRLILDPDEETYRMTAEAMNAAKDKSGDRKPRYSYPGSCQHLRPAGYPGVDYFRDGWHRPVPNGTAFPQRDSCPVGGGTVSGIPESSGGNGRERNGDPHDGSGIRQTVSMAVPAGGEESRAGMPGPSSLPSGGGTVQNAASRTSAGKRVWKCARYDPDGYFRLGG